MNRIGFVILIFIGGLTACKDEKTKLQEQIDSFETEYFEHRNEQFSNHLLKAYSTYYQSYPDDSMNAEYLFHAAEVYQIKKEPLRAIGCYNKIFIQYPGSDKQAASLFMEGFLYENELRNQAKALEKYTLFLANFPDHPLAKDVEFSVAHIGKTPEQILLEITGKKRIDSIGSVR